MPGSDLSELLDFGGASDARALNQLAAAAAASVPGCSAANVVMWSDGEPSLVAATHPDLPELVEIQLAVGRGPALDALAHPAEAVLCPDTLGEERWPEYAAAALRVGVRCSLSYANLARDGASSVAAVSLTLVGARPRCLDPRRAQMAELLGALGGAVLGAVSRYDDARRTVNQLKDGAESRAIVDQAKGILMHAFGCSAEEALARLRETSQRRNIRAIDVAREVVESAGRPGPAARPRPRPRSKSGS
jgi:hypothetical protein